MRRCISCKPRIRRVFVSSGTSSGSFFEASVFGRSEYLNEKMLWYRTAAVSDSVSSNSSVVSPGNPTIMAAFQGIGQTGSTNLGVVAPGIADALIATAAGLFAAIPAVYFYNHLTHRVKVFASEMDDFAMEFLNIVERNFT